MGRVKLKVERLETSANRQATYSKRKNGLVKKANELSVLCDIDLFLVLFSPSDKTVVWTGRNGTFERTIARLAELTPQERVKRKVDTFEALKRTYKKSDHNVNGQDFFAASYRTTEDWNMQANLLRARLSEANRKLRDWNNMHKTDSMEVLEPMEDHMRKLIDEIHSQKEIVGNQQHSVPGCHYQVQNEACPSFNLGAEQQVHTNHIVQVKNQMCQPYNLGDEQQVQHSSWVNIDNSQRMVSLAEKNMLPQRGTEFSVGSYSFSGSFGAILAGTVSTWHESSILSEILRTQSLRNELMGLRAETLRNELINTNCLNNDLITESLKLMKPGYLTNQLTKHDGFMNELVRAESLRNEGIQGGTATNELWYTFTSFSETTFQPPQQMNVKPSVDNFCTDGNFASPQPGFPDHSTWASTSGGYDPNHCNGASTSGATFNGHLSTQQHSSAGGNITKKH
ncbi:agamous-like MADS-box protein AGL30 isoform X2 [Actinidia eriantha]|uniref:agamous-like MADS-box protein AGL30 isoform X2 n=1 Tax=Actinidia eriantha TaxID=165200 RepID=UPI002584361B|nr:agamous-like MADS-box protein AGL30 isoform X2 [Actinidia eriantha]